MIHSIRPAMAGLSLGALWLPFVALADHPVSGLGLGIAAPITTVTGAVLPRGETAIQAQVEHTRFDAFSDHELAEARERDPEGDIHSVDSLTVPAVNLAYGLTDNTTIGARLPYVIRRNIREPAHGHEGEAPGGHDDEHGGQDVESLGDASGLGDIRLFLTHNILRDSARGRNAALLVGVKAPTGETERRSPEGELLETEFQPGSGSWDGMVGGAISGGLGPVELAGNLLFTVTGEGSQSTDLGNSLAFNGAVSYRIGQATGDHHHGHGAVAAPHSHTRVDLILELNGEWRARKTVAGAEDNNHGGTLVFLSPGIHVSGDHGWGLSLSAGVPVITNLNGFQVEPDYRLIATLGVAL